MANPLEPPPLGLPPGEAETRFSARQQQLTDQWQLIGGYNLHEQTMVVVPSVSLDLQVPGTVLQGYEERMLFMLLLLRKPRARIVYLTSMPIQPAIVDYYLGLLPGVIPSHARSRLHTVALNDATSRPLTLKVLERPRLIAQLRALVPDPRTAHLVPFTTTELERDLALRLGIPMYGADPAFATFGTKSGGRRLFAEEGVRHPRGTGDLHRAEEVVVALGELRAAEPGLRRAILKLDDAVSGEGNAEIGLSGLPAPGSPGEPEALAERVAAMRCEKLGLAAADFLAALARKGGIVEERVEGSEVRSPSAQLRITPLGEVQLLSTHDQLLGGPSGQSFLGCRFPADPSYSVAIAREAAKVGERLRREGVLGRFAVDFVVVRDEAGEWSPYAIEINLRKGGTTAPYLILEFLTHGRYDAGTGTFATAGGDRRCYVADDHVESESFRALTVEDVFDLAVRERLHYDQSTHSGIVFHMLSPVTEQGRIGLTAVGRDPAHADQLYRQMREALDREARAALTDPGVPPLG